MTTTCLSSAEGATVVLEPDTPRAERPYAALIVIESSGDVKTPLGGDRRRYRAQVVLFAFGLFAAVFAVIIVLRATFWLPLLHH
jgi:hypothetical protein